MFSCKVCKERLERIADLQAEVKYLRDLASPAHLTVTLPPAQAEVDKILSVSDQHQPDPSDDEVEAERDRILGASF